MTTWRRGDYVEHMKYTDVYWRVEHVLRGCAHLRLVGAADAGRLYFYASQHALKSEMILDVEYLKTPSNPLALLAVVSR